MTAKILLKYLINQLLMQQEILFITSYQIQIFYKIQLTYPRRGWQKISFVIRSAIEGPLAGDGNGERNQGRLTEKPMNKGQNPYSITLEENVDQTVHQLKVALAFDAVYFTYH